MHGRNLLALVLIGAMLLAAPLWPSSTSKSTNPCSACHGGANNQYLDILEGDAGNTLPSAISDAEVLAVAVVIEVTGNTALNNIMSGITAKLVSQNGFFSVDAATYSVGTLANGQKATAFWNISALSSGSDVMVITAAGANTHKNRQFSDSYSPSPAITVTKTAADLPPSIALTAPAAGQTFSGGSSQSVAWTVTDEDRATCQVGLYYSTDNFASSNVTIATGLPAAQGYSWTTPLIDSTTVRLKATVTDKSFKFNQSVQAGTFAIDSTAPTVLSVQPADGAADVPASTMLQAQFSEPVAASAAQAAFSIAPDPGGVVWGWDAGRTTMTAAHDAFADGTTYTCTLSTGVKDLSSPATACRPPTRGRSPRPPAALRRPRYPCSRRRAGRGSTGATRWASAGPPPAERARWPSTSASPRTAPPGYSPQSPPHCPTAACTPSPRPT